MCLWKVALLLMVALVATPCSAQLASFESSVAGSLSPSGGGEGWFSSGGTATVVPSGGIGGPSFGAPTHGNQWCIVHSAGSLGSLASAGGGPAPYPLGGGATGNLSLTILLPTTATTLSFDWNWVTPECANDPQWNDFLTVDLTQGGVSVLNLLYRDTYSSSLAPPAVTPDESGSVPVGYCNPIGPLEETGFGTMKAVSMSIPASLLGQVVTFEVNVGDGGDAAYNNYAWIDTLDCPGATIVSCSSGNPEWQVNQAGSTFMIDGQHGTPTSPAQVSVCEGETATIEFQSSNVGLPWELFLTQGPAVSASTTGLVTPCGQVVNLDFTDPTLSMLYGGTWSVPFQNLGPILFSSPVPLNLTGQMVVISPTHPDGFELSGASMLSVGCEIAETFTGTPDEYSLAVHTVDLQWTPDPTTPDLEDNVADIDPFHDATLTLDYADPFGGSQQLTAQVQIDTVNKEITYFGFPVTTLEDVFGVIAPGPGAQFTFASTIPIQIQIAGMVLAAAPPKYITDRAVPRKVVSLSDGRPTKPDVTQVQANAWLMMKMLSAGTTQTGAPADSYDCHGYTFTGGVKWINDNQVQKILDDNGYMARAAGMVMVGDLVVYRNGGAIKHSGVVRTVSAMGNATVIESKWGALGRYRHAPAYVPVGYGTPTFYHSARANGHILQTQ